MDHIVFFLSSLSVGIRWYISVTISYLPCSTIFVVAYGKLAVSITVSNLGYTVLVLKVNVCVVGG
jgi:hypothetical protein